MFRRRILLSLCLLALAVGALWLAPGFPEDPVVSSEKGEGPREPNARPNEWFWLQRAYPGTEISRPALARAIEQASLKRGEGFATRTSWVPAGPGNIGARVTDLAVHPTNPEIVYAAMASGGVFKSSDGGTSWTAIFDEQAVLPVGAITLDPQNPDVIYVGTGEANAASLSFFGLGMYKSEDAGATWTAIGLEESRYVARIVVDPANSDRVFVAIPGKLFGTNPERGVYRSDDAGSTWDLVHSLTDSTSCIDLAINPQNPDVVYAAFWERVRGLTYRRSGGPSSGIWRSQDGGDSWSELTSGLPTGSDVGRIGISVCASQPNVIYAIYADASAFFEGIYKSTDGGDTWSATNDGNLGSMYSSFGWWFGNIRVDPSNPNNAIALGLPAYRTTNGGDSWSETGSNMHVDHHAVAFSPSLPTRVYEGNDGGLYRSDNSGGTWSKLYDQQSTQFYAIGIDFLNPHRLYGGTQDNGTLRTWDGGVNDWENIHGGDGFYTIVDFTNSNVIYAEYQWGGLRKSTNGGGSWSGATNGINSNDRTNWSTPVIMDPFDNNRLYYGTYRVYRTTNGASSWSAISDDLTNGDNGTSFGTVTTIAIAESDTDVIYAGTDDSHVWVTANGGGNWTDVSATLPNRWVTRVAVDPADAAVVYATFSGLRWEDEGSPRVFRSADMGASWTDITTDLPDAPVNVILPDPELPGTLYLGTDVGAYYTSTPGGSWQHIATGLPNAPIFDLKLHNPTRKLVAGTYGRSMFTLNLGALTAAAAVVSAPAGLLPNHPNPFNPRTTLRYRMAAEGHARLSVFDARGRRIAILVDGVRAAGEHAVEWRAVDERGRALSAGVYLARLEAAGRSESRKLVLVK